MAQKGEINTVGTYFIIFDFSGFKNGPGRLGGPELFGRRSGNPGLANGEQKSGRQRRRLETTRPQDHDKSQTAGDPEDGLLADAEAHQTHKGAAREGDRPTDEGHPGEREDENTFINGVVVVVVVAGATQEVDLSAIPSASEQMPDGNCAERRGVVPYFTGDT